MERLSKYIVYEELDWNIWDKGAIGVAKACRRFLRRVIRVSLFDNFIMATVIANTIQMALEGTIEENQAMKKYAF